MYIYIYIYIYIYSYINNIVKTQNKTGLTLFVYKQTFICAILSFFKSKVCFCMKGELRLTGYHGDALYSN